MSELVQIPFRGGIDEGTDRAQLPPGALRLGRNVRQDKAGRVSKRLGITGVGGVFPLAERLFEAANGAYGVVDGSSAFVYDDTFAWRQVDRVSNLRVVKRPLVDAVTGATCIDTVLSGRLLVSTWRVGLGDGSTNTAIYVQVHNVDTWALVLPPKLVTTGGASWVPRLAVVGTTCVIAYQTGTALAAKTLSLTTFAMSGTLGLASLNAGLVSGSSFALDSDGTSLYVAGVLSAGTDRVRVMKYDEALTAVAGPTDTGGATTTVVSTCLDVASGDMCHVSWGETNAAKLASFDTATLALQVGPTTFDTSVAQNQVFAVAELGSTDILVGRATTTIVATKRIDSTHVTVAATIRQTNNISFVSRPFRLNGRWYFTALAAVTNKDSKMAPFSRVVCELRYDVYSNSEVPAHPHAATLENETGWVWRAKVATLPVLLPRVPVGGDGAGPAYAPSTWRHGETLFDKEIAVGVNVNILSENGDRFHPLRAGATTMFVGGAPAIYDGLTIAPYGFAYSPEISGAVLGAGGSQAAGTYQYACVFVRVGPDGVKQRSPASNVISMTVTAGQKVTLTVRTACLSGKLSEITGLAYLTAPCGVFIEVYRTTVGGSILYRLTVDPLSNLGANDPTVSSITIDDTRADADIVGSGVALPLSSQPEIYTSSELDDTQPTAATTGTVHRNRFWLIASDEFTLWASKDGSSDLTIAPGFSEELTLSFASRKKALASLDDKLVAFGEGDIDIVYGDGPTDGGDSSDWQTARVHSDRGCNNPRGVAVIPPGVIFLSSRGFELLSRDLSLTYIGRAVEDTLASYPDVTSAVVVPDKEEARFTCNAADGASGVLLVFNYGRNTWYTRTYGASLPILDAALIGGRYTTIVKGSGSDGIAVMVERNDGSCLDLFPFLGATAAYVPMRVEVPAYAQGAAAWHRLKSAQVVGESKSPHKLTIEVARDFATSFEQSESFDPVPVGSLEQYRVTLQHQKRQAAVIAIEDAAPTDTVTYPIGTGEGPVLELLALSVTPKSGPAKLPAAQKG